MHVLAISVIMKYWTEVLHCILGRSCCEWGLRSSPNTYGYPLICERKVGGHFLSCTYVKKTLNYIDIHEIIYWHSFLHTCSCFAAMLRLKSPWFTATQRASMHLLLSFLVMKPKDYRVCLTEFGPNIQTIIYLINGSQINNLTCYASWMYRNGRSSFRAS